MLQSRNINVDSTRCSVCTEGEEDANHILVWCPYAFAIRNKVLPWCGLNQFSGNTIGDFLNLSNNQGRSCKMKNRFTSVCYGLIWNLWRYRNDQIFKQVFINPSIRVEHIKSTGFNVEVPVIYVTGDEWLSSSFSSM